MNATRLSISVLSLSSLLGIYAVAQDKKKADSSQRETVAQPMTEKERKKKEEKLRKELETPYRKWLNEDVAYIITDEERTAFKRLQTDEEREQFIEQFWLRRDPTPDSIENEFKEEHYRRIAYANEHFASGIPGLEDRSRPHLHHLRTAGRKGIASLGRHLRAAFGRRRRHHLHLPLRAVALPLHRRHRQRHHYRIRRSHHVGRVPHDHGSVGKGRAAVRPRRRPHHDGTDGHGEQDRPLQPHRWHPPRRTVRGGDREDEPVQPAGAVRQVAAPAGRQVQGSGSRGQFAHQLQHPADEGAGGFLPADRSQRADLRHPAVRQQGPAVPGQGRRAEGRRSTFSARSAP